MQYPTERILNHQRYTFYLIGTLKPPFLTDTSSKVLHYAWEFFSWLSTLLPLHMTICYLKTVTDDDANYDLLTFVNFFMEAVWFLFSFLGMVHYKLNGKTLEALLEEIEESFKWRSPNGRTYMDLSHTFKAGKFIGLFWQFFAPMFVVASIIMPLFVNTVEPQAWYFLNQNNKYLHFLTMILQAWAKMVMVFSFSSGSSFFGNFCVLTCGQFNILRCALKNLIYTSGIYQRFEETQVRFSNDDVQAGEYTLSLEQEDDKFPLFRNETGSFSGSRSLNLTLEEIKSFQMAINNCIEHHHAILKICGKMEDFFNRFAFYRVAEITLQICFLAYMYPKVSTLIPFAFFLLTFVDIFLITYPSQHVQWHNECLGEAILLGPWHLISRSFYRDFIILMAQSSRPIKFTAMKIIKLDVSCLKGVITTAFSYYTLLTKFEN